MITFYINDHEVTVPEGTTILQAAREIGVEIPTLCHLDLHSHAMDISNEMLLVEFVWSSRKVEIKC